MVLSFSSSSGVNHPTKPIGGERDELEELCYEAGGEMGKKTGAMKKCKNLILFTY
jgi:hypothetical protein